MYHKHMQDKPVSLDTSLFEGVDDVDRQSISRALERQETLTIDYYGHVYNQFGKWIADAKHM